MTQCLLKHLLHPQRQNIERRKKKKVQRLLIRVARLAAQWPPPTQTSAESLDLAQSAMRRIMCRVARIPQRLGRSRTARPPRRWFNVFSGMGDSMSRHDGEGSSGVVASRNGGVAVVRGLESARRGELIKFSSGVDGLVVEIRSEGVVAAILGDESTVRKRESVVRQGRSFTVPVGSGALGRVVDILGRPLDGKGPLTGVINQELSMGRSRPEATPGANSAARGPPILAGLKAIDAFYPMVRGGRFGVVGGPLTRKTDLALSVIANQVASSAADAEDALHFVYVCIGKSRTRQERVVEELRSVGALDRSVVVCAEAGSSAMERYFAPLAGSAYSTFFRDNGMHSLIVYDEFSRHHSAFEEVAAQGLISSPSLAQTYAEIVGHALVLPESSGGGSTTALALVDDFAEGTTAHDVEPRTEELMAFLDSTVHLDEKLGADKLPGVSLASLIRTPISPYQLPVARAFYARTMFILRSTQRLSERAKIAREVGIDVEEESNDDVADALEFPAKFERYLNDGNTGAPLGTSLVATYFAARSLLFSWPMAKVRDFDEAVNSFLFKSRPELRLPCWPLDQEVPEFIFDDLEVLFQEFVEAHGSPEAVAVARNAASLYNDALRRQF